MKKAFLFVFLAFFIFPSAGRAKTIPTFTLESLAGKTYSSNQDPDSVQVVYIWASWCKCCKKSWKVLKEIHESTRASIHGIAVVTPKDQALHFAETQGIPKDWILLDDEKSMDRFKIQSVPEIFVYRNGKEVFRYQGPLSPKEDELRKAITNN